MTPPIQRHAAVTPFSHERFIITIDYAIFDAIMLHTLIATLLHTAFPFYTSPPPAPLQARLLQRKRRHRFSLR